MTDADDVLRAAHDRAAVLAVRDETALRGLLHPAFGWTSHRGDRFDRDTYLTANCRGDVVWHAQELRDPVVTVVWVTRPCSPVS